MDTLRPATTAAPTEDGLARFVRRLALVFALSVGIGLPCGYFALQFSDHIERVDITAELKAQGLTALVAANPELWVYQMQRVEELLMRYPPRLSGDSAIVRDGAGNPLVSMGAPQPAPVIVRSYPIYDSGRVVGQVEITHSYRKVLSGTLVAGLLGSLLGALVYATLLVLPLRALRRATTALVHETEALSASASRYRAVAENASDAIITADGAGTIIGWNPAAERIFGYTESEIIGQPVTLLMPHRYRDRYLDGIRRIQAGGERRVIGKSLELHGLCKAGREFPLEIALSEWETAEGRFFAGIIRDITERKRAEEALARASYRSQVFLRNASDGVHILDADGNVLEVSDSFCEMLGYSREELVGAHVSLWDAQWSPQELKQRIAEQTGKESHSVFETRHRRRDGIFLDVEVTGQGLKLDGKPVLFNSARDITMRKREEQARRAAEEQFRGLVEQSIAGIYIIQDGTLAYVNPRMAEILGYASEHELIGTDLSALVVDKDVAAAADIMRRLFDGSTTGTDHTLTARRKDGSTVELGLHSTRASFHGRPAVIGMMQDISEKKRAEEQIRRYVAQLESTFMSTVQVATTLSEMRDPYTAGHERRVAEIAVAIGAEIGFDARRQEGLRVAGYLHDIGKITIPSEILSKPGKLSPIEFKLIQGHARASYDVLKEVEFPWPVAEVALQHHERVDGSGYPQGLKGDAILLEARIMAVADVVEAMSSHRPYRPGLGIDKALAEIERGRGTAYDIEVADACLKLFREKGYAIAA